jgi:hypothetical protein
MCLFLTLVRCAYKYVLLFWPVLCFFRIPVSLLVSLNSVIFMISSLFLLIVLFGHPIFLNTFSYFVSLLFLDFHLLLVIDYPG